MIKTSTALENLEPLNQGSLLFQPAVIQIVKKSEETMRLIIEQEILESLKCSQELTDALNKKTGKKSVWLGTTQAATYCSLKSKNAKWNWGSTLQENCRSEQVRYNDIGSPLNDTKRKIARRGNQHKLGRLDYTDHKGSVYYSLCDLDRWLCDIEDIIALNSVKH